MINWWSEIEALVLYFLMTVIYFYCVVSRRFFLNTCRKSGYNNFTSALPWQRRQCELLRVQGLIKNYLLSEIFSSWQISKMLFVFIMQIYTICANEASFSNVFLLILGLTGVATFTSLKYVTEACKYLEELSIAYCGLSGNATTLGALQQALLNCYNLKRFRWGLIFFFIFSEFYLQMLRCYIQDWKLVGLNNTGHLVSIKLPVSI